MTTSGMTAGLTQLFRDTFTCLSLPATLILRSGGTQPVRILVRQPESWVAASGGEFLSARLEGEIRIRDAPRITVGDALVLANRHYKIFQEPLKDPSGTVWLVHAMIADGMSANAMIASGTCTGGGLC